jgi:putative nucleotidyltransferase with HDIG domain
VPETSIVEPTPEQTGAISERLGRLQAAMAGYEGALPTREEAVALLFEHTEGESLRGHMLAVEASMRAYADKFGADSELFGQVGLLHDMDYEKHPDPSEHPLVGCEILHQRGYPVELIDAVLGHAPYTGVPRKSLVSKTLFAVDELTGFLTAVAYMRPTGLEGLTWKSFKKKFKTPRFAAGVNRDEVLQGAEELGVDMTRHVLFLADALTKAFPGFPRALLP